MLHSSVRQIRILVCVLLQHSFQDLIFPNSTTYGINSRRLDIFLVGRRILHVEMILTKDTVTFAQVGKFKLSSSVQVPVQVPGQVQVRSHSGPDLDLDKRPGHKTWTWANTKFGLPPPTTQKTFLRL